MVLPSWAEDRPGWKYVGWIGRKGGPPGVSFEGAVETAKHSDHGELRAVDVYPEGGVCWIKPASNK